MFAPGTLSTRAVCPDNRGYWGDYDDMDILSVSATGVTSFLRAHSDSTPECATRWTFTSSPLHVTGQIFWSLLVALSAGCGRIAVVTPDAAEHDAGTDAALDVGIDDASRDRNTQCGLAPEYGDFACCDAGACLGFCSSDPATRGTCHCGRILGGCAPPYLCCRYSCRTEAECAYIEDQPP